MTKTQRIGLNLGTSQDTFDAQRLLNENWELLEGEFINRGVNLEWFIQPTKSVSDALDDAIATGKPVFIPVGEYLLDRDVDLTRVWGFGTLKTASGNLEVFNPLKQSKSHYTDEKMNEFIRLSQEYAAFAADAKSDSTQAIDLATTFEERLGEAESLVKSTHAEVNEIVRTGDSSLEAAQARVSSDGTVYPTLKDRLDDINDNINEALEDTRTQLAETEQKIDNLGIASAESYPRLALEVDDTGRLQRAIDDPDVRNIVLKRGTTYSFTTLTLKNDVRIYGEDRSTSKLKHVGTGVAIKNPNATAIGRVMIDHLTLELNMNTTIGIEFARVFNSQINFIDIIGGESTGVGISFDDGAVYSAYYNSCYDVSISGFFNGANTLGTGFKFANSANSNRLVSCRTNYVKVGVDVATDYTNHIVIFGCSFEQFDTGVRLNGDICQVIATRFENAGGAASGVGIEITASSGGNTILGNTVSNILTPLLNNNPTGNNHILDYGSFSVKYLSHESDGGWKTSMNMRNNAINEIGHMAFTPRTVAPPTHIGRIAYADGSTWNPGYKSGLYVSDGAAYRRINYHREGTTANRPSATFTYVGFPYFDTTLGKPIWWNGTSWVDAMGSVV